MPTILRTLGLRFYFYSHEPGEPPHVHVDRSSATAKLWLTPVTIASSVGFAPHELNQVLKLVRDHRQKFLEAWRVHFDTS